MKSQKGITLISLVVYIMVSTIAVGTMAVISSNFYFNVDKTKDQSEYADEFNKFNMFFIQDVKTNNIATITSTTVDFENGNSYIYDANKKTVTRNGTTIARNVQNLQFTSDVYTVKNTTKNLVRVNISLGKNNVVFQKEIEYVLKYW